MKRNLSARQIKIFKIVSLLVFLCFIGLTTIFIGKPMLELADKPEEFRIWINDLGVWGMIVFVAMVFIQVIFALIPGEPLELAAGYAFGPYLGTLLCIIGILLGSIIVFISVRKFGAKFVEVFFNSKKISDLKFLKYSKKRNVLMFVVFVIPGTPKDLLCYFAGLTDVKLSFFIFLSTIGRIPSIVTSTVGGGALGDKSYILAIIVFGITLIISALGLLLYKFICKKQNKATK